VLLACLLTHLNNVLFFHADIVRCLSGITDALDREINFEIVWIDDTTFLVAASVRGRGTDETMDEMDSILREHGNLIHLALRQRFPSESIIVLETHLRAIEAARSKSNQVAKQSWMDRTLSFFGLRSKKREADDGEIESHANKRRRVS